VRVHDRNGVSMCLGKAGHCSAVGLSLACSDPFVHYLLRN
jgi:hypothetical protein